MLACTKQNKNVVEYLLSRDVNVFQTNKDGWSAFQIAVRLKLNRFFRLVFGMYSNFVCFNSEREMRISWIC